MIRRKFVAGLAAIVPATLFGQLHSEGKSGEFDADYFAERVKPHTHKFYPTSYYLLKDEPDDVARREFFNDCQTIEECTIAVTKMRAVKVPVQHCSLCGMLKVSL